jgi:dihydrofolate synthase/folylpolyglutamate synthase
VSLGPYSRAIARLYALEPRGVRPGLRAIRSALRAIGDPQRRFVSVLIAGTNGKGSVAAMVERALRASGVRTGLYTSPHLHRFTERIRIDGREVAERDVVRALDRLAPVLFDAGRALTFFEATTALAMHLFARARVRTAVVEVGLGGRLDATTVVRPRASAIVSIGIDHTDKLGSTLRAIAREKAGILRRGVPTVIGALPKEARRVIEREGRRTGAVVVRAPRAVAAEDVALGGDHQRRNAAVALETLRLLGIDPEIAAIGPRTVRWPGRLERVGRRPAVVLDVAHNAQGCRALRCALGAIRPVVVIGVLQGKQVGAMVRALAPMRPRFVWCRPPIARGSDPRAHAARFGGRVVDHPVDALHLARRIAGPSGTVVVCGSFFVVGSVRAALRRVRADPPIAL